MEFLIRCDSRNDVLLVGSMTDSICTSYETNYPKRIRGGFHASQSTVNEMQGEESTGTSPKKSVTNMERRDSERRIKLDFSTVLGGK